VRLIAHCDQAQYAQSKLAADALRAETLSFLETSMC